MPTRLCRAAVTPAKRHLDQFSHYCTAYSCAQHQHADTHADNATSSLLQSQMAASMQCMRDVILPFIILLMLLGLLLLLWHMN